jgi:hypothetical protein
MHLDLISLRVQPKTVIFVLRSFGSKARESAKLVQLVHESLKFAFGLKSTKTISTLRRMTIVGINKQIKSLFILFTNVSISSMYKPNSVQERGHHFLTTI